MHTDILIPALDQFEHFRGHLFSLYEAQHARLARKEMPWGRGATWGYWLAEYNGHRSPVERAAASIGEDEIRLFHDCCELLQPKSSFVIGHSFGLSTFSLALACPSQTVIAIDNWSEPHVGEMNRSLSEKIIGADPDLANVRLVTGTSPVNTGDAIRQHLRHETLTIAFIDGLHRNAAAAADFEGLLPHLDSRSVVFWHNVNSVAGAFENSLRGRVARLFDTQVVLATHGPMGVYFSSQAHPELLRYIEWLRLSWPTWKRDILLLESEQLVREELRRSDSLVWRAAKKIGRMFERQHGQLSSTGTA